MVALFSVAFFIISRRKNPFIFRKHVFQRVSAEGATISIALPLCVLTILVLNLNALSIKLNMKQRVALITVLGYWCSIKWDIDFNQLHAIPLKIPYISN